MHILVTGGTGFIGSALLPALREAGHRMTVLTRQRRDDTGSVRYLRDLAGIDERVDAVINLAGASLAGKRWNAAYKQEIIDSRIGVTQALGNFFGNRGYAPGVWLNASAIGYYGAHGDERLDESAPAGEGFSAQLCRDWEQVAIDAAGDSRLCLLRLGVVLDREGGAYQQMAQPFRMGVANWIGDGQQYLSWIHRTDVVAAMLHLLNNSTLAGPCNLTAPQPVTSRAFCSAMKCVHRTFLTLPMPAPVMRALVGEMADELLLTGQRVLPKRLLDSGFRFTHADIEAALRAIEA